MRVFVRVCVRERVRSKCRVAAGMRPSVARLMRSSISRRSGAINLRKRRRAFPHLVYGGAALHRRAAPYSFIHTHDHKYTYTCIGAYTRAHTGVRPTQTVCGWLHFSCEGIFFPVCRPCCKKGFLFFSRCPRFSF